MFPRALMCALALTAGQAAAAPPIFSAAPPPIVGVGPLALAAGDLNGDGRSDLVVANSFSSDLSILLSASNGTFQLTAGDGGGSVYAPQPFSVALGDFNGDGKADVAVANFGTGTVSVMQGDGAGGLKEPDAYRTGVSLSPSPYAVAVADFNGDRRADLALANFDDYNAAVLLGAGDGSFASRVNYAAGTATNSLTVGDFNGDGRPDLALANGADNNVSVLIGSGDGTFRPQRTYAVGNLPYSIASGDFNGDGYADLAVANRHSNTVSVLLANSDGSFRTQVTYEAGGSPFSVASADFNGDGKADLAVVNRDDSNVSVLTGNGDGSFQPRVNFAVGSRPHAVAVGDFNGDGKPDMAVVNFVCQQCRGDVSVLINRTLFVNDEITGTWYSPAVGGQAFTFEIFPNRIAPGRGQLVGEWFTFAPGAPGGDDRQRWFSIQGELPSAQNNAELTLYRNVGGNFAAPPPTVATPVGSVSLRFDSCTQGRLTYRLDDGSGLSGTIPLSRLTGNGGCPSVGTGGLNYADPGLTGNWYNVATSGQGFFFDVNPAKPEFFGAWYTYAPNGQSIGGPASQRWYTLQSENVAPGGDIFQNLSIYQTIGGSFDAPPSPSQSIVRVGTASVLFSTCTSASIAYSFFGGTNAGRSGTISLQRAGPVPAGCRF